MSTVPEFENRLLGKRNSKSISSPNKPTSQLANYLAQIASEIGQSNQNVQEKLNAVWKSQNVPQFYQKGFIFSIKAKQQSDKEMAIAQQVGSMQSRRSAYHVITSVINIREMLVSSLKTQVQGKTLHQIAIDRVVQIMLQLRNMTLKVIFQIRQLINKLKQANFFKYKFFLAESNYLLKITQDTSFLYKSKLGLLLNVNALQIDPFFIKPLSNSNPSNQRIINKLKVHQNQIAAFQEASQFLADEKLSKLYITSEGFQMNQKPQQDSVLDLGTIMRQKQLNYIRNYKKKSIKKNIKKQKQKSFSKIKAQQSNQQNNPLKQPIQSNIKKPNQIPSPSLDKQQSQSISQLPKKSYFQSKINLLEKKLKLETTQFPKKSSQSSKKSAQQLYRPSSSLSKLQKIKRKQKKSLNNEQQKKVQKASEIQSILKQYQQQDEISMPKKRSFSIQQSKISISNKNPKLKSKAQALIKKESSSSLRKNNQSSQNQQVKQKYDPKERATRIKQKLYNFNQQKNKSRQIKLFESMNDSITKEQQTFQKKKAVKTHSKFKQDQHINSKTQLSRYQQILKAYKTKIYSKPKRSSKSPEKGQLKQDQQLKNIELTKSINVSEQENKEKKNQKKQNQKSKKPQLSLSPKRIEPYRSSDQQSPRLNKQKTVDFQGKQSPKLQKKLSLNENVTVTKSSKRIEPTISSDEQQQKNNSSKQRKIKQKMQSFNPKNVIKQQPQFQQPNPKTKISKVRSKDQQKQQLEQLRRSKQLRETKQRKDKLQREESDKKQRAQFQKQKKRQLQQSKRLQRATLQQLKKKQRAQLEQNVRRQKQQREQTRRRQQQKQKLQRQLKRAKQQLQVQKQKLVQEQRKKFQNYRKEVKKEMDTEINKYKEIISKEKKEIELNLNQRHAKSKHTQIEQIIKLHSLKEKSLQNQFEKKQDLIKAQLLRAKKQSQEREQQLSLQRQRKARLQKQLEQKLARQEAEKVLREQMNKKLRKFQQQQRSKIDEIRKNNQNQLKKQLSKLKEQNESEFQFFRQENERKLKMYEDIRLENQRKRQQHQKQFQFKLETMRTQLQIESDKRQIQFRNNLEGQMQKQRPVFQQRDNIVDMQKIKGQLVEELRNQLLTTKSMMGKPQRSKSAKQESASRVEEFKNQLASHQINIIPGIIKKVQVGSVTQQRAARDKHELQKLQQIKLQIQKQIQQAEEQRKKQYQQERRQRVVQEQKRRELQEQMLKEEIQLRRMEMQRKDNERRQIQQERKRIRESKAKMQQQMKLKEQAILQSMKKVEQEKRRFQQEKVVKAQEIMKLKNKEINELKSKKEQIQRQKQRQLDKLYKQLQLQKVREQRKKEERKRKLKQLKEIKKKRLKLMLHKSDELSQEEDQRIQEQEQQNKQEGYISEESQTENDKITEIRNKILSLEKAKTQLLALPKPQEKLISTAKQVRTESRQQISQQSRQRQVTIRVHQINQIEEYIQNLLDQALSDFKQMYFLQKAELKDLIESNTVTALKAYKNNLHFGDILAFRNQTKICIRFLIPNKLQDLFQLFQRVSQYLFQNDPAKQLQLKCRLKPSHMIQIGTFQKQFAKIGTVLQKQISESKFQHIYLFIRPFDQVYSKPYDKNRSSLKWKALNFDIRIISTNQPLKILGQSVRKRFDKRKFCFLFQTASTFSLDGYQTPLELDYQNSKLIKLIPKLSKSPLNSEFIDLFKAKTISQLNKSLILSGKAPVEKLKDPSTQSYSVCFSSFLGSLNLNPCRVSNLPIGSKNLLYHAIKLQFGDYQFETSSLSSKKMLTVKTNKPGVFIFFINSQQYLVSQETLYTYLDKFIQNPGPQFNQLIEQLWLPMFEIQASQSRHQLGRSVYSQSKVSCLSQYYLAPSLSLSPEKEDWVLSENLIVGVMDQRSQSIMWAICLTESDFVYK